MHYRRPNLTLPPDTSWADLLTLAFLPGNFFHPPDATLLWEMLPAETVPFELYRGQLLPASQSRETRTFQAWNVYLDSPTGRSAEPIVSAKLDHERGEVHILRAVLCYVWEGVGSGNVIESRETERWVRERVTTLSLASAPKLADFHELLAGVFQAVVGTSRLPLTSVEAPLPGYTLGQLGYFFRGVHTPALTDWPELLAIFPLPWADLERVKLLELLLRTVPDSAVPDLARSFARLVPTPANADEFFTSLLRSLFNEVSLSPYTQFVPRTLRWAALLVELGCWSSEAFVDLLAYLLRQTCRHLTGYDLVTFHHFGANYPDALVLNEVLKIYLGWVNKRPELFVKSTQSESRPRLRRRALRQAWLVRTQYEGHLVPKTPTSLGESQRVLPTVGERVTLEEIRQPSRRQTKLYENDRLGAHMGEHGWEVLQRSIIDLQEPSEVHEQGLALFLDRPLRAGNDPLAPDQSLLVSYLAYSPSLAKRRLLAMRKLGWLDETTCDLLAPQAAVLPSTGVALATLPPGPLSATVSLAEARQVADDFVLVQTTTTTWQDFCSVYEVTLLGPSALARSGQLLVRIGPDRVAWYHQGQARAELVLPIAQGETRHWGGTVWPSGLRIEKLWDEANCVWVQTECVLKLRDGERAFLVS